VTGYFTKKPKDAYEKTSAFSVADFDRESCVGGIAVL
jgi:hypothetical protein